MLEGRRLFMIVLLLTTALAGCAAPEGTGDEDGVGSPDGDDGDAGTPETTDGDDGGDEGAGTTQQSWSAYAFDRTVTATSGELGQLTSYSYDVEREEDGVLQAHTTTASYDGIDERDVRTVRQSFDQQTGEQNQETVTNPFSVHQLVHEIEILQDDTGEREAGQTATATMWLSAEDLETYGQFQWFFLKMGVETEEGTDLWEYALTEEMQQEMQQGQVFYLPYTEGDGVEGWWAFEDFAMLYGLQFFQPFVQGDQELKEGSYNYGGGSYSIQATSFEVSGHTFDGYTIETSFEDGESSSSWTMTVSPDLPVPYHVLMTMQDDQRDERTEHQLTAVSFG